MELKDIDPFVKAEIEKWGAGRQARRDQGGVIGRQAHDGSLAALQL
jgi:hypothetical protein